MPTRDSCGAFPSVATDASRRTSREAASASISVAASDTELYSSSPIVSSPITRRLAQSVYGYINIYYDGDETVDRMRESVSRFMYTIDIFMTENTLL